MVGDLDEDIDGVLSASGSFFVFWDVSRLML